MRTLAAVLVLVLGMASIHWAEEPQTKEPELVDVPTISISLPDSKPSGKNETVIMPVGTLAPSLEFEETRIQELLVQLRTLVSDSQTSPKSVIWIPAAKAVAIHASQTQHQMARDLVQLAKRREADRDSLVTLRAQYQENCEKMNASGAADVAAQIIRLDPFYFAKGQPRNDPKLEAAPILPAAFKRESEPKDLAVDPQFNLLKAEFEKTWKLTGPLEKSKAP